MTSSSVCYVGLTALILASITKPTTAQTMVSSVPEMLVAIARDADPERNEFLNDQRVALYRSLIEQASGPAAGAPLRFTLAQELLRAGRTTLAIRELQSLLQWLAQQPGVEAGQVRSVVRRLAVANLRLGEQENCLLQHNAESCLVPIRIAGIHVQQQGSRAAIKLFETLLAEEDNLSDKWLLNLAYMTVGEYPGGVPSAWLIQPDAFASEGVDVPVFEDVAGSLGINHAALSGGVVADDLDGDGYLDLLTSSWGLTDTLRFYRNNADGTFSDWTERAGLVDQWGGLNLVHADYDNDGDADVLVLRGAWLGALGLDQGRHPNSLLRNDGQGSFTDVTVEAGLLEFQPTQTAAWADFDRDGNVDLFIGNESTLDPDEPGVINAYRCRLFRNQGDGTFEDVAPAVGLDHIGFVKGVAWGDYDNDGWPDLYLSQHGQLNVLFHNDGPHPDAGWRFSNTTQLAGVGEPRLSFPTWFWDYNNDGWMDLFVAAYENYYSDALEAVVVDYLDGEKATYSRLYRNNRDGSFTDVTRAINLDAVLLAMGASFGDLDNDGYLDAYFGTGQPALTTLVPNRMFRNDAAQQFHDVTTAGGFGHVQKGHGIAFADFDNDGDQDIYAVMGGAYSGDVYPNALFVNPGTENHSITLVLEGGPETSRGAVGARVRLVLDEYEDGREVHRAVGWGSSFGSAPRRLEIGVGKAQTVQLIEVTWPDRSGRKTSYKDVAVDKVWRIRQDQAEPRQVGLDRFDLGRK